jgi:hypothetical protein
VAYALGGGALVGVGIGAIAGELSVTQHDSARAVCPVPSPCGDAHAASTWTRATTAGSVSTVGFVSAGVLAAAAVVVWIVSPATTTSGRVSSMCGARECSLGIRF